MLRSTPLLVPAARQFSQRACVPVIRRTSTQSRQLQKLPGGSSALYVSLNKEARRQTAARVCRSSGSMLRYTLLLVPAARHFSQRAGAPVIRRTFAPSRQLQKVPGGLYSLYVSLNKEARRQTAARAGRVSG